VPRAKLACGRVGDDGDGMAVQLSRPALRLLSGQLLASAASWCACMARGIGPPRVVVDASASGGCAACHGPHLSRSREQRRGLVVRGRDLSCEVETCHARRRLLGGVPLVRNWSEVLPTGREQDVLPMRVLTGVLDPPRPESWPSRCQSWPSHCQWCQKTLSRGRLSRRQRGP
jgi:hypothetical protein